MTGMVLRRVKKLIAWVLAFLVLVWLAAGAYWVVTAV
jgi:hypothetical protein